jgi:hypothetical protein
MRLPNSAHEAHPWVIAKIAPDFKLLDVWALPVRGGPDDFDAFVEQMASLDATNFGPVVVRVLFRIRLRLGAWFGWDDATKKRSIPGRSETSLAARLPHSLRGSAKPLAAEAFTPLYRTDDEWAAEVSNDTVHGVLHLAWIEDGDGRYRAQMGVYVKAHGRFGEIYLKLIAPFRHFIVYPALMRHIGRVWETRTLLAP